jgi:hypothetical protein
MSDWTEIDACIYTMHLDKVFSKYHTEDIQVHGGKVQVHSSPWFHGSEGCPEFTELLVQGFTIFGSIRDRGEEDVFKMILQSHDLLKTCRGFGHIKITSNKSTTLIECYPKDGTKPETIKTLDDQGWSWIAKITIKKTEDLDEFPTRSKFEEQWRALL